MSERRGVPPPAESKDATKERFDKYGVRFDIVEDEAYRERLEHLRDLSNQLNKRLQKKFDETDLPYYSWNKSSLEKKRQTVEYPKILRLAVLLRPEFYQSRDKRTSETRYTTGDEQVTIFLHVRADNAIQLVRFNFGWTQAAYGLYFADSFAPDIDGKGKSSENEKALIESYIRSEDMDGLAEHMIERITPPSGGQTLSFARRATEVFKQAYNITSLDEAKAYFSDQKVSLYQPREILRNLGKVTIISVLEKTLVSQLETGANIKEIERILRERAAELLDNVDVGNYHNPGRLKEFIPDPDRFVDQIVKQLLKAYKPRILGWEK